jgi:hypothetical protein
MKNINVLNKILAIAGTVLVWIPILAPILFAVLGFFRRHRFLLDYLMPAELGLLVLIGAGLLLWAALRMHVHQKLIIWTLVAAVVLLVGSQGLAVLTGLANGDTPMGGWQWALVLGMLIGYDLAVIVLGVGGVLLLRHLFKPAQ